MSNCFQFPLTDFLYERLSRFKFLVLNARPAAVAASPIPKQRKHR